MINVAQTLELILVLHNYFTDSDAIKNVGICAILVQMIALPQIKCSITDWLWGKDFVVKT